MEGLTYAERLPDGDADGLLILHHGRGADETDLLGLAEVLDPAHRLHVVSPRAPFTLSGWGGYHWYAVPRVGYPDPATFHASYQQLSVFHEATWQRTGIPAARTVLGGFSMGTVMSFATGLGTGRPRPAGIIAFSGFIPTVDGWAPEFGSRQRMPVLVAHGRNDQIIGIEFAKHADAALNAAGLEVTYHETGGAHAIDPTAVEKAIEWLRSVV